MGKWHEAKRTLYREGACPCNGCQGGYADLTQKFENGKLYEKFDYCQETCQRYKDWEEDKEHFFGNHIREAAKIIRG